MNLATEVDESAEHPPVAKVVLSTTLEGEIGDGGFDTQIVAGSGTFFAPDKVQSCGRQVASWATGWARAKNLSLLVVNDSDDRSIVHVAAPDGSGFFRIWYSRASDGSEAAGSLSFHDLDGNSTTLQPKSFPALDLGALPGQLKEAMECKRAP